MNTIELSDQQITYLLLSLRAYERQLLEKEGEDMEDAVNDLLIIQGLINQLHKVKSSKQFGKNSISKKEQGSDKRKDHR